MREHGEGGVSRDAATGAVLLVVGVAAAVAARRYGTSTIPWESASLFPTVVSAGLLLVGASLLAQGMARGGKRPEAWPLRPCAAVTASVLAFAALIGRGGLIPTVTVAVLVAGIGSRTSRLQGALLLAIALALGVSLLFVVLLRQPLDLLPRF